MPFRKSNNLMNQNIPEEIYEERSMIRSAFRSILPLRHDNLSHLICSGRASVFTSERESKAECRHKKGSITIEAAMAVPLFFFAVVCLLYLMEIMAVQTSMRAGLQYAGKEIAGKAYPAAVVRTEQVKTNVINAIGPERLERSIVEGGGAGINCQDSLASPVTGIGELSVKYKIRIPVPVFQIAVMPYEETMRIKTWTGYEKSGFGAEDDTIVYVTETGLVYHRDYHCTHLDLSIRMAAAEDLHSLRNENGGKYHACERCGGRGTGQVYITNQGDRYHNSLSCSGLKRTVYAIPVSEAAGKRACSKCGGK